MSCRCQTKFRFLYRTGGWYHWESVLPVRGSLHEHITCGVAWFWSWPNWTDETLLHDEEKPRHEHRDHVQVARDGTRCWCGMRHEY
jgi:hypothetical protein